MIMRIGGILCIFMMMVMLGAKELPLMDEDIGQAIFQNNQLFLIYVCQHPNDSIIEILNQFCGQKIPCTLMSAQAELYWRLKEFVGMSSEEYLLFLDVPKRSKYTLPIVEGKIQLQQVQQFYVNFKQAKLQRYYTSESLPTKQNDPYLQKIVGQTFEKFIGNLNKVKVVYLYTESQLCDNCFAIYQKVVEVAKKYISHDQVVFGHLDLFKNEHRLLQQEVVPLVLVYNKTSQKATKIEPKDIDNLQKTIEELLHMPQIQDL